MDSQLPTAGQTWLHTRISPLEEGGLDEALVVIQVVADGGQDGPCNLPLAPLLCTAQFGEQLCKGCICKDAGHQLGSGRLGQVQEPSALLLNVQRTLRGDRNPDMMCISAQGALKAAQSQDCSEQSSGTLAGVSLSVSSIGSDGPCTGQLTALHCTLRQRCTVIGQPPCTAGLGVMLS